MHAAPCSTNFGETYVKLCVAYCSFSLHSSFIVLLLVSSHAALASRMTFVEDFEVVFHFILFTFEVSKAHYVYSLFARLQCDAAACQRQGVKLTPHM